MLFSISFLSSSCMVERATRDAVYGRTKEVGIRSNWESDIVPRNQHPLTHDEYKGLQETIADLVASCGLGPVKAAVNRRPEPQDVGRPKVWHQFRLYTLWLIVKTWALRENHKIDRACKRLAKIGGLVQDNRLGGSTLVSTAERIRRLFYEADLELDNYESEYKGTIRLNREECGTLKERLLTYAEILANYEFFFASGLAKASEIVHYEVFQDGLLHCDPPPLPPFHPPEMAMVELGGIPVIDPPSPPVHTRHRSADEVDLGPAITRITRDPLKKSNRHKK
jgi:hypothetical protein